MSATTPNDIWAAGVTNTGGSNAFDQALIAHSNGSTWTSTGLPRVGDGHNDLAGVYVADPNDVWAAGNYQNAGVLYNLALALERHRLDPDHHAAAVDHRPGARRHLGRQRLGYLGRRASIARGSVTNTLALHWNGTAWTEVASPNAGSLSVLENVYARPRVRVWPAGYSEISPTSGIRS